MNRSNADSGIAIVSVLLVMVAVMLLGLGTLFLTQMNLGIAQNVKGNALAEDNATSGMSAALVTLQEYYSKNSALPSTFQELKQLTPDSISGQGYSPSYSLVSYVPLTSDTATITVNGTVPGNAEYVSAALIQISGKPSLPSFFDYGLATEGTFKASGSANYVSAGIHANEGFRLSGSQSFHDCTLHDRFGNCVQEKPLSPKEIPIAASPGATTCHVSGSGNYQGQLCKADGTPRFLTSPVTIDPDKVMPDYAKKAGSAIQDALQKASHGTEHSDTLGIDCDKVYSSAPSDSTLLNDLASLAPGATVCIESGRLSFSGTYNLSNVNLVSSGDVSFSGSYSLSNVNVVSTGGDLSFSGSQDLSNINLISSGDIELSGSGPVTDATIISTDGHVKVSGSTTLDSVQVFAQDYIKCSGSTALKGKTALATEGYIDSSGSAYQYVDSNGDNAIGIVMVAKGDIDVSGSTALFIAAVAGGKFDKSGSVVLHGRIASKGKLTISGSFNIDSSLPIDNGDIKTQGSPVVRVISRR
jgi:hypothetical protein